MYNAAGQIDKDQLVRRFAPLVKRIAYHLMGRLPASVQADDLVQNGMIGLLDAIERFETGLGAQFETYASQRIRGAMLDGLRENDWLPRGLRRELRRVESAISKFEQEYGRAPAETELAAALKVPLADYQKMLQDARGHQILSLEDLVENEGDDFFERHFADEAGDPSKIFEDGNMRRQLVQGIDELPEREKMAMALYYERDFNLREIGEIMGVSESRVCQLHSQAVARLRVRILGEGESKKIKARRNG
ncbi:MAG: RNA polymerase sigma factor FliA [Candidatus Accumulibacter sp.]|jgi:RNA polymerase sigma factor for flagellar operon FliA|nr:RNA polymerase sigma factor FliA [Accumulibacter sp.]